MVVQIYGMWVNLIGDISTCKILSPGTLYVISVIAKVDNALMRDPDLTKLKQILVIVGLQIQIWWYREQIDFVILDIKNAAKRAKYFFTFITW